MGVTCVVEAPAGWFDSRAAGGLRESVVGNSGRGSVAAGVTDTTGAVVGCSFAASVGAREDGAFTVDRIVLR